MYSSSIPVEAERAETQKMMKELLELKAQMAGSEGSGAKDEKSSDTAEV